MTDTPRDFEQMASLFKSLAHPARLRILLRTVSGRLCVRELQENLGRSQANVSQHLRILRDQGLVVPERRGNEVCYHLADPRIARIIELGADMASSSTRPRAGSDVSAT